MQLNCLTNSTALSIHRTAMLTLWQRCQTTDRHFGNTAGLPGHLSSIAEVSDGHFSVCTASVLLPKCFSLEPSALILVLKALVPASSFWSRFHHWQQPGLLYEWMDICVTTTPCVHLLFHDFLGDRL